MGIISLIASSIFIWMIWRSHDGLSTTQHRILLGLCIADISFSINCAFLGSPVPKDIDYLVWNAVGSMSTCQLSIFFTIIGAFLGPWYNASLVRYLDIFHSSGVDTLKSIILSPQEPHLSILYNSAFCL